MIFDLKSNKILFGMRISKLKTNAEKAILEVPHNRWKYRLQLIYSQKKYLLSSYPQ